MKKVLASILIIALSAGPALAKYESGSGNADSVVLYGKTSTGVLTAIATDSSGNVLTGGNLSPEFGVKTALPSVPTNSTFIKNYGAGTDATADSSTGSSTATVTTARTASAPATYITIDGTVTTTTTANAARITHGFYDNNGFHSLEGLLVEQSMTNQATYSAVLSNAAWVASNMTVTDNTFSSPDGGVNADTLTATAASATLTQTYTTGSAQYTASIYLKRLSGTGAISLSANNGTNTTVCTPRVDGWIRCTDTRTGANPTVQIIMATSGDTVLTWGAQLEANGYATTYIPNATTALTRPSEKVTYATSGNLTSARQTTFIKFAPEWNQTEPTTSITLFNTDTKQQRIILNSATDHVLFNPNSTDSSSSSIAQLDSINRNQSIIFSCTYDSATPTASIYTNGFYEGVDTDAITAPVYGTNFYVGSSTTATLQSDSIIQEIRIYNTSLTTAQIMAVNVAMGVSIKNNILPLGDSITDGGSWSYRKALQIALNPDTYLMVGNKNFPTYDPDSKYSTKNAGVSGETTTQILARTQDNLTAYFQPGAYKRNSWVIIHAGTNDITLDPQSNIPLSITAAITNIKSMIDLIDATDPEINILVSTLIPRTDTQANFNYTDKFNTELKKTRLTWSKKNIYLVDLNAAFLANRLWDSNYMSDDKHPKTQGWGVMAKNFASAIQHSPLNPKVTNQDTDTEIIGGDQVSSGLKLKSTTAPGSSDFVSIISGDNGLNQGYYQDTFGNVGIGSTVPSSKLDVTGAIKASGNITSSGTSDLGWSVQAAANQACNTTCVSACVVGFNLTAGVPGAPLACTDATADTCICAGAS